MQTATIITLLVIPFILVLYAHSRCIAASPVDNVYNIASRNLMYINNTNNLQSVMQRYFFQLYVRCYRHEKFDAMRDIASDWITKARKEDVVETLTKANADAVSQFWAFIDEAEAKHTNDISFKIDETYDYHILPKSLMYNDTFVLGDLITAVDNLLEVN